MEERILVSKKVFEEIINTNNELLNLLQKYDDIEIQEYKNIKSEDMEKKEEYIKNFEKTFEIKYMNIDTSKLPLLKYILREFGEDLYMPSEKSKKIREKRKILGNKLRESFTEEQKEKFEKYVYLESQETEELEEQLFMYGFIMAQELYIEGNSNKNKKNSRLLEE